MESSTLIMPTLSKLRARGISLPRGPIRLASYGDSAISSEQLLALIRNGRKRANTCLLWSLEAEDEPLPRPGDIEIVLDHRDEPALLTRLVKVDVMSYAEVGVEHAAIEGEGNGSLDYWREVHWAFFSRECARVGRQPAEDMLVVCSVFELLAILPSA